MLQGTCWPEESPTVTDDARPIASSLQPSSKLPHPSSSRYSTVSTLEPIASEADIRIGIDGIVLVYEFRRATFLPVMWERLKDKKTFMGELRRKAGLPRDFAGQVQLMRYTVDHFEDRAP